MPTIEQILAGAPHEVQLVVKAPHYVVDQGRVYWQKMKVPRDVIPAIVGMAENGIDKTRIAKGALNLEMEDIKKENELLKEKNEALKEKLEDVLENVDVMKRAHTDYMKSVSHKTNSII